mgnify:FL=1|tara:strand:- start:14058 stop:14453 length:396 start_codon:yes stop_codon:yes gene_type:complete
MRYRAGYKYQLVDDLTLQTTLRPDKDITTYYIDLTASGLLTVRRGYAYDGPSGPTYDSENSMVPSLFHDAIYQLMRLGLLSRMWRPKADYEFESMLEARGMWWIRRKLWLRAVRLLAAAAARDPKPILTAP